MSDPREDISGVSSLLCRPQGVTEASTEVALELDFLFPGRGLPLPLNPCWGNSLENQPARKLPRRACLLGT